MCRANNTHKKQFTISKGKLSGKCIACQSIVEWSRFIGKVAGMYKGLNSIYKICE